MLYCPAGRRKVTRRGRLSYERLATDGAGMWSNGLTHRIYVFCSPQSHLSFSSAKAMSKAKRNLATVTRIIA